MTTAPSGQQEGTPLGPQGCSITWPLGLGRRQSASNPATANCGDDGTRTHDPLLANQDGPNAVLTRTFCSSAASGTLGLRTESEPPSAIDAPAAVTPLVRGITTLAVVAVALVAAVASYDHQRALAALAGEDWRAWLLPVSVDGLVLAASMSMLVRRRAGMPVGALSWASLLAGIGASLAANVAAAEATTVGRVVAAWPPVALLLAWELLMQVRAPGPGERAQ
jgi:Protein of unknown function (DUF2637)